MIKGVLKIEDYCIKLKEFEMKIINSITIFGPILSMICMKPISATEIGEFDGTCVRVIK